MDNSQMDGYAVRAADVPAAPVTRCRVSQRIAAGPRRPAAGAGHRRTDLHRRDGPAGCRCGRDAGAGRAEATRCACRTVPAPGDGSAAPARTSGAGTVLAAGTRLTPQALRAGRVGRAGLAGGASAARVACFFTGDELAMPGEPLAPGAHLQLQPLRADRAAAGAGLPGARPGHRARFAGRHARRAAPSRRGARPDRHVGRHVGRRGGPRQAGGRGRGRARPVADRHQARQAARFRRGARGAGHAHFIGLPGNPVSSFVTFLLFVRPFVLRAAGHHRRGAAGASAARRLRLAAPGHAARVPARAAQRRRRAGAVPQPEFGRADLDGVGRRSGRDPAARSRSAGARRSGSCRSRSCCGERDGAVLRRPARSARVRPRAAGAAGRRAHRRCAARVAARARGRLVAGAVLGSACASPWTRTWPLPTPCCTAGPRSRSFRRSPAAERTDRRAGNGGAMGVRVQTEDFDLSAEVAALRAGRPQRRRRCLLRRHRARSSTTAPASPR